MKKYYQAALALTAALSLIALLFYRHEYNKLRFVLQVFNYFGSPSRNPSNETCLLADKLQRDFSEPSSTWQRLTDNLHVFSAYHVNDEVRVIAFGSTSYLKTNPITCSILTNPESPRKVTGNFSFEITSEDDTLDLAYIGDEKFYGLILVCRSLGISSHDKITGVQLLDAGNTRKSTIKVRNISENDGKNDSVVCVAPTPAKNAFIGKRMDLVTFVAFHRNIGLGNFIVYDSGISDTFNSGMKSLSRVLNMNFTYSTVSWNFPYDVEPRVIRHLVEVDCLYRGLGRAGLALTLAWNEYVNLKYHSTMASVVLDFNKVSGGDNPRGPFGMRTFAFCMEGPGEYLNFSTPMILSTTKRVRGEGSKEERRVYQLGDDEPFGKGRARKKLDDLIGIYRYELCEGEDVVQNQLLRFAENTPGSNIFQYYLTGRLFGD
ncbi:uncharacterized protein [Fopius arisanus]|uniref:PyrH_0 protein n=1 Tax=Fopius arisanus TaxID=64838 RepID=A0A0C9R1Y1_9HYME|nr:PREDICTED: uncharacterized protein LOC105271406 [Fopius arisanus]